MKSIELFAGAGGLGMGLCRAGFKPAKVVEWDRYCRETIRENRDLPLSPMHGWPEVEGDVRGVDFSALEGKVELVSGGPPCQPFSMGGKHKAYDDARDMFPQAIRAVRETRPKAFIFENVKGLTRASFRNYFEYIRLQLEHPYVTARPDEDWADHLARLERHHTHGDRDGAYRVIARVLNAADYGVPQKRERVIFVGFRDDLDIEWSFPVETHSSDALLWAQHRDGSYWDRHKVAKAQRPDATDAPARASRLEAKPETLAWRTVRDAIADLPDPELHPKLAAEHRNHRFQPGARSYPGHTGSPLDEPAKTLKAGVHGVPGGENMLARPDGTVRYFSVRESARLQTFADDFVFHGSWSETMRQLGNAVPVRLAEVIGKDVARKLRYAA
ncbi:MAG: DNA cytosine methyltransferase [Caulobacter sp.]|nr:DNA cytosine methyltransferase [Caulobacter sp.]